MHTCLNYFDTIVWDMVHDAYDYIHSTSGMSEEELQDYSISWSHRFQCDLPLLYLDLIAKVGMKMSQMEMFEFAKTKIFETMWWIMNGEEMSREILKREREARVMAKIRKSGWRRRMNSETKAAANRKSLYQARMKE